MTTPNPKTEIIVYGVDKEKGYIIFHAPRCEDEFSKFGKVSENLTMHFRSILYVDPRFDFDEVLAHLKTYEPEDDK